MMKVYQTYKNLYFSLKVGKKLSIESWNMTVSCLLRKKKKKRYREAVTSINIIKQIPPPHPH